MTTIAPFDKNGDGDCDDDGEIVQRNTMADSEAIIQMRLLSGPAGGVLNGRTTWYTDLNAINAPSGLDEIPIEIVSLTLTGEPQPITVTLRQVQPSVGTIVEAVNVTAGNLDAMRFEPAGTVDGFFNVFVEIDVQGMRLVTQEPLQMLNVLGIYPPAPGQTWFLQNNGVLLFDANTGQPAGILDRFDWTPHVAPRRPCLCEELGIVPVIRTSGKKGQEVVESPAPSGAISADDEKVYDVEVEIQWTVTLKCGKGDDGCEGEYAPSATSEGWMIDGKKSAPVGLNSHKAVGPDDSVICAGVCDSTGRQLARTLYKVSVRKGAGGIVTHKVSGLITLAMNPVGCAGASWKMVLVYEADLKKDEVRIDSRLSNWDGDKKHNAADKNPLDPTKN